MPVNVHTVYMSVIIYISLEIVNYEVVDPPLPSRVAMQLGHVLFGGMSSTQCKRTPHS